MNKKKCSSKTKKGESCKAFAMKNGKCVFHSKRSNRKNADLKWKQHAESFGFKSEKNMLKNFISKHSLREIAEKLGYSIMTISCRLKRYKIKNPNPSCISNTGRMKSIDLKWNRVAESFGFKSEKEMLSKLIVDNSLKKIGKELRCSWETVCYRLKRHEIRNPRRKNGYYSNKAIEKRKIIRSQAKSLSKKLGILQREAIEILLEKEQRRERSKR